MIMPPAVIFRYSRQSISCFFFFFYIRCLFKLLKIILSIAVLVWVQSQRPGQFCFSEQIYSICLKFSLGWWHICHYVKYVNPHHITMQIICLTCSEQIFFKRSGAGVPTTSIILFNWSISWRRFKVKDYLQLWWVEKTSASSALFSRLRIPLCNTHLHFKRSDGILKPQVYKIAVMVPGTFCANKGYSRCQETELFPSAALP